MEKINQSPRKLYKEMVKEKDRVISEEKEKKLRNTKIR